MDERFIEAWTGHPHLRVIDNSCDFEGKMRNLIREITYFLGELAPYEIERKFLVRYPNIDWLESLPHCERVKIVQHYLRSDSNEEIRIRRRTSGETSLYYLTQKHIEGQRRSMRTQRRLTKGEYHMMATQIDPKSFFFTTPMEWQQRLWPTEDYELARSRIPVSLPEDDLFAGIEP